MNQLKKPLIGLLLLFSCLTSHSQKLDKDEEVYNAKILDSTILIKGKQMISTQAFDKLIRSSINNYVLFNKLSSNVPSVKADFLEKELALEYNKDISKYTFLGLGFRSDYDAENSLAGVYSSGTFAGNLKFNAKLNIFFPGYSSYNKSSKDSVIKKLNALKEEVEKKAEAIKDLRKALADKDSCSDCEERILQLLYYGKDPDEDYKKLISHRNKKLDEIFENAKFNTTMLQWISPSFEIGNPLFNTYDSTLSIGERLDDRSIFSFSLGLSYNALWIRPYLTHISLAGGFKRGSNKDEIKATKYFEETILTSVPAGVVYNQKSEKAFKHHELKTVNNFTTKVDFIQILFPELKLGLNETLDVSFPVSQPGVKPFVSNSLGVIFPVVNKKDKIITMLQFYWKVSGRTNDQFDHDLGLKVGLPINLDKKVKEEE